MADSAPFDARGDFIDGAFVLPAHASGEIELEDPGDTRSRLGAFPFALESVDAAVAAARRAAPAWRDRRPEERADLPAPGKRCSSSAGGRRRSRSSRMWCRPTPPSPGSATTGPLTTSSPARRDASDAAPETDD